MTEEDKQEFLPGMRRVIAKGNLERFKKYMNALYDNGIIEENKDSFIYYELLDGWAGKEWRKIEGNNGSNETDVWVTFQGLVMAAEFLAEDLKLAPSDKGFPENKPMVVEIVNEFAPLGSQEWFPYDAKDLLKVALGKNEKKENQPVKLDGVTTGVDVNAKGSLGRTGLLTTLANKDIPPHFCLELAKFLLENGADVNVVDCNQRNALMKWAERKDLFKMYADASIGWTEDGGDKFDELYEKIAEKLVKQTTDLTKRDSVGLTARHIAEYNSENQFVKNYILCDAIDKENGKRWDESKKRMTEVMMNRLFPETNDKNKTD